MKFIFVSFFCPDASVLRSTTTELRRVKKRKGWGFSTGSFKRSQLTIKLHFLLQYHPHGSSLWTTHSSLVFYIYTESLSVKRKILSVSFPAKPQTSQISATRCCTQTLAPLLSIHFPVKLSSWPWICRPGIEYQVSVSISVTGPVENKQ